MNDKIKDPQNNHTETAVESSLPSITQDESFDYECMVSKWTKDVPACVEWCQGKVCLKSKRSHDSER